jgi:hypothetical protein
MPPRESGNPYIKNGGSGSLGPLFSALRRGAAEAAERLLQRLAAPLFPEISHSPLTTGDGWVGGKINGCVVFYYVFTL